MKLTVNGNVNEYYVQTLCMLFFPGSKFSKSDITEGVPEAEVTVNESDGLTEVTVRLVSDGKCVSETCRGALPDGTDVEKHIKNLCGKAFFSAGKKLLDITPQWGILTGVRPAKIAYGCLEKGMNKNEIKSFLSKEMLVDPKKAALVTNIAVTERKIVSKVRENTCSVYISIPFCPSRCSYCSFVSFTSKKLLSLLDDYMTELCKDIEETFKTIGSLGLSVSTVYVGGGTPTTLNEKQMIRLLNTLGKVTDISALEEFTFEAGRPDTVTKEKLDIMKASGVTRISVNTQTLNDEILEAIGRKHTSADYFRAFELARNTGFRCINTDMIAGLPNEGFGSFSESVDRVIELKPENLTFHTLCIKNAADFARNRTDYSKYALRVTEKNVNYSQLSAKNAGYIPYYIYRQKNTVDNLENVGFALPGTEGRYNIYMMEEIHSIFAVGAGAVTKFVSRDRTKIERIFDYKYPYEYLSPLNEGKAENKMIKAHEFYEKMW